MAKQGEVRTEQVSFRAEKVFVERVDELRAAMKKRLRGVEVTRSDLLKALIEMSLPLFELQHRHRVDGMTDDQQYEWFKEFQSHLNWLYDTYDMTDDSRAVVDFEYSQLKAGKKPVDG